MMTYLLFMVQAVVYSAGVLILRANLDGFDVRSLSTNVRGSIPIVASIILHGLSFVLWLAILAKTNVSHAYPVTIGLTLVFTLLGARIFLNETISAQAALGVALISIGVLIVTGKSS